jgi:hypothetical protein
MRKSVIGTTALLLALVALVALGADTAQAQRKGKTGKAPADPNTRRTRRFQGVDFNVNVQQMQAMLQAAQTHPNRTVKELAKRILGEGVVRVTGAHSGGFGGGGRPADPQQHCTTETRPGNRYHVYLKQKGGRWLITNITGP